MAFVVQVLDRLPEKNRTKKQRALRNSDNTQQYFRQPCARSSVYSVARARIRRATPWVRRTQVQAVPAAISHKAACKL